MSAQFIGLSGGSGASPCIWAYDTTELGVQNTAASMPVVRQRLPTEAIGSTTLTLTNIVVGSRYRIERAGDGSLATPTGNAEGVAADTDVPITLDVYAPGNANNNLRIKVRKGTSAPKYLNFETLTTLILAAQSIYIAQVADTIAA